MSRLRLKRSFRMRKTKSRRRLRVIPNLIYIRARIDQEQSESNEQNDEDVQDIERGERKCGEAEGHLR
jgi:hypothetical protein